MKSPGWLSAIFIIALLCACCGCMGTDRADLADAPLRVAVTILPQAEFVEAVGGDRVSVMVMIPPGANPATYEPTTHQMADLSLAHLYIALGTPIPFEEAYLGKIAGANTMMQVINSSEGVVVVGNDPHVWLSAENARLMAGNIAEAFGETDPAYRDWYADNAAAYCECLSDLQEEINLTFAPVPESRRKFLVFHPAWCYFAREYGLEEIAIEEEGKEPGTQGIASLISRARAEGIRVVFVEPQFSTKSAEAIAGQINATVVAIDPLARNYRENLLSVAKTISASMLS